MCCGVDANDEGKLTSYREYEKAVSDVRDAMLLRYTSLLGEEGYGKDEVLSSIRDIFDGYCQSRDKMRGSGLEMTYDDTGLQFLYCLDELRKRSPSRVREDELYGKIWRASKDLLVGIEVSEDENGGIARIDVVVDLGKLMKCFV